MLDLDEIVKRLADRNSSKVAAETKLHKNTVMAVKSGKNKAPLESTLKLLSDYLEKNV